MSLIGIIPARYDSSRFPGKPLVKIAGVSMIERVYTQCTKASLLSKVVVATDDQRIYDHVQSFGGNVMMTDHAHRNGTERCNEVSVRICKKDDYILNIQGDEPFISPEQINNLAACLDGSVQIATMIKKIDDEESLFNPNVVKAVVGTNSQALYFSRQTIPHVRGVDTKGWLSKHTFYKHLGIYAYRADVLSELVSLLPTILENTEALEQLRWLENGYSIKTVVTDEETIGIDTPEDLIKAEAYLHKYR